MCGWELRDIPRRRIPGENHVQQPSAPRFKFRGIGAHDVKRGQLPVVRLRVNEAERAVCRGEVGKPSKLLGVLSRAHLNDGGEPHASRFVVVFVAYPLQVQVAVCKPEVADVWLSSPSVFQQACPLSQCDDAHAHKAPVLVSAVFRRSRRANGACSSFVPGLALLLHVLVLVSVSVADAEPGS